MPKPFKQAGDALTPFWRAPDGETEVYCGDALTVLRHMPAGVVQCCVTSPPYWGLRAYATGDAKHLELGCERVPDCLGWACGHNCAERDWAAGCYTCRMVLVFREVRRVLRGDGTLWLNLGDSYCGKGGGKQGMTGQPADRSFTGTVTRNGDGGLGAGNLCGIPWRVALALQADGWVLRQDVVWAKPSAMPECLDPDTRVFIRKNGWVSRVTLGRLFDMRDRLPEVLGPDGWVKVKSVWKTVKPAMSLEVGKIERIICSPDHRFPVSHDVRRSKTELLAADSIRAEKYKDYLLYQTIEKHLCPILSEWEGVGFTGDLGYILGLYAAEGSLSRGYYAKWTINVNETYIVEKFQAAANALNLEVAVTPSPTSNSQDLSIVSDWLQRTIQTFVLGRDAKTKKLNVELLLNSPKEFRERLLEGYIDGDGSDRQAGGWSASSASRDLRDDVSTLASSLGILTSKGYGEQTGFNGMPQHADKKFSSHSLWTPYKNRSTKEGTDGVRQVLPRRRKMLEGEREMIDLEVEGGLFLIGDGLVAHNSVQNRCTKAHEYVFLLTKRGSGYFYDAKAIKEKADVIPRLRANGEGADETKARGGKQQAGCNGLANKRSVWTIAAEPLKAKHYAAFPSALARTCLKAGARPGSLVLDPFLGSGTTALVARGLRLRCWGIDLSAEYLEKIAVPRLNEPFKVAAAVAEWQARG